MWVYLSDGFISIVAHHEMTDCLLVRARRPEILSRLFPAHEIDDHSGGDYKYRVFVNREDVAKVLSQLAKEIDYSNFKSSVSDPETGDLYHQVWAAGFSYQR